jgi:pyruvate formate lyase activating enzyme
VNVDTLEELISKHMECVGPDTPLHFTRYHPDYEFSAPGPEVKVLERAVKMARDAGVRFPYIGNVRGHDLENTKCPKCGHLLIARNGHVVTNVDINAGRCPKCDTSIPIVGDYLIRTISK